MTIAIDLGGKPTKQTNSCCYLLEIDVRLKQFCFLDADCLVVGFSAFSWEIHCETTATRKVTVKSLRYIPLQEQFDNFSIIEIIFFLLARFEPTWQRYPASQSYTRCRLSYLLQNSCWHFNIHKQDLYT